MKPLTEFDLRMVLKDKDAASYTVPKGTVVTPAAAEYLKARRVELVFGQAENQGRTASGEKTGPTWSCPPRQAGDEPEARPKELFIGPDGGQFDHKPEALTHLKGRQLVYKDHPLIIWRGKLDSLCARIVEAQLAGSLADNQKYIDELEEILGFVRRLLSCEIRGREVEDFQLLGLDAATLRERSHNPVKFFGHRHMLTIYKMGPLCVALNTCRTLTRETELAAAQAFKNDQGQTSREDIIRALNRLSSLFYIMMFDYLPENFKPEPSGI